MADPATTRVLVIEDDPNIVDLVRSNLAVRGFDTVVSSDGSRALFLLETEQPDIVLLDLMLPEADGFELCRQIRERSAVGVIVVSARGGEHDKVTALNAGAEAARRAGINLGRIRRVAFTLAGLTAGAGGIIYASRLGSISNNFDGGTLVLYAIASAVIGGTSLFGGRGKMVHGLLGGLVIATIYNGMGLLGISAAAQYMVTALVLLAAATVDALARRGRTA